MSARDIGGYNSPNAARAWTYLTSIAVCVRHLPTYISHTYSQIGRPLPLDSEIPDHKAFPLYSHSFTLDVPAGNMQDMNKDGYLCEVEQRFEGVLGVLETRLHSES